MVRGNRCIQFKFLKYENLCETLAYGALCTRIYVWLQRQPKNPLKKASSVLTYTLFQLFYVHEELMQFDHGLPGVRRAHVSKQCYPFHICKNVAQTYK